MAIALALHAATCTVASRSLATDGAELLDLII